MPQRSRASEGKSGKGKKTDRANTIAEWFLGRLNTEGYLFPGEKKCLEAALIRMGLRSSADEWDPLKWELLAWFASFAARDLTHLADTEWDEVVSELWVVEKLATLNLEPADLSREAACKLQEKVRACLTELCDNNVVRLGPFATEVIIYRGEIPQARIPAAQQALGVALMGRLPLLIGNAPREGIAFQLPPSGPDALLHCLAQLLHRYPGAVRRCPLCHSLFAQFRKSAVFCSRQCQAVQAARDWRIAQKNKKSVKQRRTTKSKGRKKHGTKR